MNELVQIDKLNSDQDAFAMAIIASHGENLPDTIQEIIPILAFSKAKMEAFNALSDAARKVQDQEALNKAALESGQRWGIVHLYGQKRLGEITPEVPRENQRKSYDGTVVRSIGGTKSGISERQWTDAERIAKHPEIMEKVIEDAKERGDIPTKGAVLSRIKAESYKTQVLDKIKEEAPDIDEVANSIACKLGEMVVKIMKIWEHKDMISDMNVSGIKDAVEHLYEIVMEE